MINKKIKKLNQILKIGNKRKKRNKKLVTTNGVFDILHLGHVKYLENAKSLGDVLIVGVNTDKSTKQNKSNKRPINNQNSRIGVLAALESIDYVFLFDEKDPRKWLAILKPNIHVKAGDYKLKQIMEKDIVEQNGGIIIIAKIQKGHSTTGIINNIVRLYCKKC